MLPVRAIWMPTPSFRNTRVSDYNVLKVKDFLKGEQRKEQGGNTEVLEEPNKHYSISITSLMNLRFLPILVRSRSRKWYIA